MKNDKAKLKIAVLFGSLIILAIAVLILAIMSILNADNVEEKVEPLADTYYLEPTPTPKLLNLNAQTVSDGIDWGYLVECSEKGTVQEAQYTTEDYVNLRYKDVEKTMYVYLPYGYNENEQYDVLFLMHGIAGDEKYWLTDERPYKFNGGTYSQGIQLSNVLDQMNFNGLCKPTIVVSFTYYLNDSWKKAGDLTSRDATQVSKELVYDIIPYLADNYSTYCEGTTREQIALARDHFGFFGASYGSIIMMRGVLCEDLDVISYFGACSGNSTDTSYMLNKWAENELDQYPINYFLFTSGDKDEMRSGTLNIYKSMIKKGVKIDDTNSCYIDITNAIHEDRVWINGIYNCLIKFFK